MKPFVFHPEAEEEFVDASGRYALIEPDLGARYYDEIKLLIAAVCTEPNRFPAFDQPFRRAFSRDFPYAVIFRDEPGRILIIAVMHMARRPGYWKTRLA